MRRYHASRPGTRQHDWHWCMKLLVSGCPTGVAVGFLYCIAQLFYEMKRLILRWSQLNFEVEQLPLGMCWWRTCFQSTFYEFRRFYSWCRFNTWNFHCLHQFQATDPSSEGSSSSNIAAIAGSIAAVVVLFLVAICTLFICKRRRSAKAPAKRSTVHCPNILYAWKIHENLESMPWQQIYS